MILLVPGHLLHEGGKCEALPKMVNGKATVVTTRSMSFKCNSGYNLLGPEKIDCENGVWTDTPPTCLPIRKEYIFIRNTNQLTELHDQSLTN